MAAPLDLEFIEQLYEIRGALDALAARSAASGARPELRDEGLTLIRAGRAAVAGGRLDELVRADLNFHRFVYEASGNALLLQTATLQWHHTRRVMTAYLRLPASFKRVWAEHQQILDAIVEGDAPQAESVSRLHALASISFIVSHWNADRTPRVVGGPFARTPASAAAGNVTPLNPRKPK
jgi:DNA-binding GntR family transcriptional regulator